MGCLECDRNGCEHVMCDRFSWQLQYYICHDCFNELVEYVNARGGIPTKEIIETFMESEKSEMLVEAPDSFAALNQIFTMERE